MADKFWTDDFDVGYYDKVLEKGLDDIEEQIYPDYAIEIDIESYDPW